MPAIAPSERPASAEDCAEASGKVDGDAKETVAESDWVRVFASAEANGDVGFAAIAAAMFDDIWFAKDVEAAATEELRRFAAAALAAATRNLMRKLPERARAQPAESCLRPEEKEVNLTELASTERA